jgi:hypothetical protein
MGQMAKGLVNGLNTTLAQEDRHRHGEDFNSLRGVRSESSGKQAHGQEAANAMD